MTERMWWELPWRLIGVALAIWAIVYARRVLKRMRDKRGRLPAVVDEKRPDRVIEGSTKREGVYQGVEYQLEYHPGKEDFPPFLVVSVLEETDGDFMVTRSEEKGWFRRKLKQWGVSYVKTGDKQFDGEYDIVTESTPGFAKACLAGEELRGPVKALFETGFTALRNDGKGIDAIWTQLPEGHSLSQSFLEGAVAQLASLVQGWGTIRTRRFLGIRADTLGWNLGLIVPFLIAFSMFADMLLAVGGRTPAASQVDADSIPIWFVLMFVAPLLLLWLAVLFFLAKGRYNSHAYLAVVGSVTCIVFYFGGSVHLFTLNAALDRGEPTAHVELIHGFAPTDSGSGYDIVVPAWLAPDQSETIFVSNEEYEEDAWAYDNAVGLEITTKPGYFGFEWILDVRPIGIDEWKSGHNPAAAHGRR